MVKSAFIASMMWLMTVSTIGCAEVLQGSVSTEEIGSNRIHRSAPTDGPATVELTQPDVSRSSGRIHRTANPPTRPSRGIDLDSFETQSPTEEKQTARELWATFDQVYQHSTETFDIGVDRNSKELVLAWEKWHKQFCETVYYRTCRRTSGTTAIGSATVRVRVTRDHKLSFELTDHSGSPFIAQAYSDCLQSMDGNPGLTFPAGSQRDDVSFSYQFMRATNIRPGYDWKHGDYETVRQEGD